MFLGFHEVFVSAKQSAIELKNHFCTCVSP